MGEFFSWGRVVENFPLLIAKFPVTLEIVVFGFGFGAILALFLALIRIKKIPVISQIVRVFISFERGTPMLVQMLVVYYAFPLLLEALFDLDTRGWERLNYVIITFILNEGAFLSETFRAAITAIPKVQTEAALSCGLTASQTFFRIVLPQSVRIAIPPMGLNLIGVFMSTSLVFMIGVIDIVGMAQAIGTRSGHSLESYLIIALLFVLVNQILTRAFRLLDKRLSYGSGKSRKKQAV